MRIIKIANCCECPHIVYKIDDDGSTAICTHSDVKTHRRLGRRQISKVPVISIPGWCPLEEVAVQGKRWSGVLNYSDSEGQISTLARFDEIKAATRVEAEKFMMDQAWDHRLDGSFIPVFCLREKEDE